MNDLTVTNNITSLAQWTDLTTRADFLAKSELIPVALRGKPANVAIILQIGCELGVSPMQAINGISVIQGKPTVDPQLAVALIRSKVPNAFIKVDTCEEPGKEPWAKVTMARSRDQLDESYTATWTMDKARKMDLAGKDNYKKQPATMLRWRATMEAARAVFPDVLKGLYSPDELDGVTPPPTGGGGDDKAARLKNLNKTEPKEVQAEVVSIATATKTEPDPAPTTAQAPALKHGATLTEQTATFDPYADYVPSVGGFKDKRLGDYPRSDVASYATKVRTHFRVAGKEIAGAWLEFLVRADEYVAQGEEVGTFADFQEVTV